MSSGAAGLNRRVGALGLKRNRATAFFLVGLLVPNLCPLAHADGNSPFFSSGRTVTVRGHSYQVAAANPEPVVKGVEFFSALSDDPDATVHSCEAFQLTNADSAVAATLLAAICRVSGQKGERGVEACGHDPHHFQMSFVDLGHARWED
jgi:hypothetical protein